MNSTPTQDTGAQQSEASSQRQLTEQRILTAEEMEIEVPSDVMAAAILIENHAMLRGWGDDWELYGLCSRTFASRLKGAVAVPSQLFEDLVRATLLYRNELERYATPEDVLRRASLSKTVEEAVKIRDAK